MLKARASGLKVYVYFMTKGRQARHRIPRNSCVTIYIYEKSIMSEYLLKDKSYKFHFENLIL